MTSTATTTTTQPARRVRRRTRLHIAWQRSSRVVQATLGFVVAAAAWTAVWALLVAPRLDATDGSPRAAIVATSVGLVVATAPVLWCSFRRWDDRIHRAEQLELRARTEVERIDRARSVLVTSVSHELRTPLTTILGAAQTIGAHQERLGTDRVADLVWRMEVNARRLERVVGDVVAIMAPSGEIPCRREPVELRPLLQEQVLLHGGIAHDFRIHTEVDEALLDEAKVRRIVGELVRNVVRHTPDGTRARVTCHAAWGQLHLTVSDDGPGVEDAIRQAIAEPFVQGQHVDGMPSPGLGLGLALVRRYAELHDGVVTLDSPPGGGTSVDVVLPLQPAATAKVPAVPRAAWSSLPQT